MTTDVGGNVDGEGQEAGAGPGAQRAMDTMEGFAFEDEDELDAIMQMEQLFPPSQKQVVPTTTTSGVVVGNGDNTKPKEQND